MIVRQILVLMLACSCYGEVIILQWDPNPADQKVIAYEVYRVKNGCAQMVAAVSASTTQIGLNWYQDYPMAFYVTAINQSGEGFPSNYVGAK